MTDEQHPFLKGALTSYHETAPSAPISAASLFRRRFEKVHLAAIEQLDYRRERQVFFLTDGKRSIAQIADLLRIHPVEVAQMMRRLLEPGYVEYVQM